jgi:serine/threonine protein kinase
MAPEILEEEKHLKPYNEACDIYSFGVICYELFLGHLPFKVEMENMYDVKITWKGITKEDCSELDP